MSESINILAGKHRPVRLSPNLINNIDVYINETERWQRLQSQSFINEISLETAKNLDLFYSLCWINGPIGPSLYLDNIIDYLEQPREIIQPLVKHIENLPTRGHCKLHVDEVIDYWKTRSKPNDVNH